MKEKVGVLRRNYVENMLLYREKVVDLVAQCIKSGRMVIIHVFSDGEISTSSQEEGEGTIIRDLIARIDPNRVYWTAVA